MSELKKLGWDDFFESQLSPSDKTNFIIARIVEQHRGLYKIRWNQELVWARSPSSADREDPAAVGDWILGTPSQSNEPIVMTRRLDRRNKLSRKAARGKGHEQVLAVNVDTAFIVSSLNQELNVRRLERYLTLIRESGVQPALVLTKADISLNIEELVRSVKEVALETPIHVISDVDDSAVRELTPYFAFGKTVLLLGSSGVGKSTLVNLLLGTHLQEVNEVRVTDDKGRHTTTARRLMLLPSGGMLIDSPGMREVQLLDSDDGIRETFSDLMELATRCRFSDCKHNKEPNCAVQDAVKSGAISAERFGSFKKLGEETKPTRGRRRNR